MSLLTVTLAKDWVANGYSSNVNIYEITRLDRGAAAILATKNEDLGLDQLKELDDESAVALSGHKKGDLSLRGLRKVSGNAAAALSKHPGKLDFYHLATTPEGAKSIKGHSAYQEDECSHWFISYCTQEMARSFAEDPENAALDDFQCFSPGAAKIYASAKCETLNLQSLELLESEDAQALASFPGQLLLGQVLPYLSHDVLKELGKHRGGMRLGIESISGGVLEHLRDSGDLELLCVNKIPPKDAEPLRNRKGKLSFGSLNEIDGDSAAILATAQGDLDLEYLFRIPKSGFEALANHQGTLRLGIKTLNYEEALALVKHKGPLELPKLRFLLPDTAKVLSTFLNSLVLDSVTMPKAAISYLEHHPSFDLPWISNNLLTKEIADFRDSIDIGPISLLGEDAELSLMKKQENEEYKNLDLESILAITDKAAENISKFRGTVTLGVYELTNTSAAALAKHRGTLVLNFLHRISGEGAKALSRHKDLQVSEHYLPPNLYKIITNTGSEDSSSSENHEKQDDSNATETKEKKSSDQLSQDIHFNLGRFRARYGSSGSRMGGFKDLLDEIEEAVKAGADLSFLKTEQLIVDFLQACQKGEDTSQIRKQIDDSFWEG